VTVRVAVPWEQISGKELQGWVGGVDGLLSATIPGPSAEPPGPGTGAESWLWAGTVTARLDLDGQPVHLVPDIHSLMLVIGEPGCYAGWDSTCLLWCWTGFELRPDEDIWFHVTADLQGDLPVSGRTCPVDMVAHRAWVPVAPGQ
jgi:hypothetical protein